MATDPSMVGMPPGMPMAAPPMPMMPPAAPAPGLPPAVEALPMLGQLAQEQTMRMMEQERQMMMLQEQMQKEIMLLIASLPTPNPAGEAAVTAPLTPMMDGGGALPPAPSETMSAAPEMGGMMGMGGMPGGV